MPIPRLVILALLLFLPWSLKAQEGPWWVAVGAQGRRASSIDGMHWKDDRASGDALWRAVAYGGGRFFAVGGRDGKGAACWRGADRPWIDASEQSHITAIAYGRGLFVGVAGGELLSSDGTPPFTAGARLPWAGEIQARQIACGDTEAGFRFVVIGEADLADKGEHVSWRGVSDDGKRWTHAVSGTAAARALAYGAGIFVVVGPGGLVETSHDGEAWDRRDPGITEDFSALVWDGRRFLAQGTRLWSSPDGIAWQATGTPPPKLLLWAAPEAALGTNWEGQLVRSIDLTHWLPCEMPVGPPVTAVASRPAP